MRSTDKQNCAASMCTKVIVGQHHNRPSCCCRRSPHPQSVTCLEASGKPHRSPSQFAAEDKDLRWSRVSGTASWQRNKACITGMALRARACYS